MERFRGVGRSSNAMNDEPGLYSLLETTLVDILALINPDSDDMVRRWQTIRDIRFIVHSVPTLKGATVNPFGSFSSNLFTKWGDVDISIQVSQIPSSVGRRKKVNLLRNIMDALSSTGSGHTVFIPGAREPVLVFKSTLRNISIDISVDNHRGLVKSKILFLLSNIDGRFRDLVLIIKQWAKSRDVNDPKTGTLSSYSICLLIIFHFQTCNPAIFPPLMDIYGGNLQNDFQEMRFTSLEAIENQCSANIERLTPMLGKNKSSLRELLLSFFQKFSRLKEQAKTYAICTYTGQYQLIISNPHWSVKPHKLIIEDPFEIPDNAGRAIHEVGFAVISGAFADTLRKLSSPIFLSDKNAILNTFLSYHGLSHQEVMSRINV